MAPVVVLVAADVVLAGVGPELHLDDDELLVALVAEPVPGAEGYVDRLVVLDEDSTPLISQVASPWMTTQCSERCSWLCSESREPGFTWMRLIL